MGKRSRFQRRPRDTYDTPFSAVQPLIAHLKPGVRYLEPCAGRHDLVDHLAGYAECVIASDIAPRDERVFKVDAATITAEDVATTGAEMFITNCPWDRAILHALIVRLSDILPTWLLFDADWMHTRQATPHLWRLRRIVSVGRVKWIEDSPHTGKDNAAWFCFDARGTGAPEFFGRGR